MTWRLLVAAVSSLAVTGAAAIELVAERSDAAQALIAASASAGESVTMPVAARPGARLRPLRIAAAMPAPPAPREMPLAAGSLVSPYDVASSLGDGAAPPAADEVGFAEPAAPDVSPYAFLLAGIGLLGVLYHRRTRG